MERTALARAYYDCLDGHDYERLASILAADFVHDRPDLTLDGRERFVRFMREERPDQDTTHEVEHVYRSADDVAVTGQLYAADGSLMTTFLDAFSFVEEDGPGAEATDGDGTPENDGIDIQRITTYTHVGEGQDVDDQPAGDNG